MLNVIVKQDKDNKILVDFQDGRNTLILGDGDHIKFTTYGKILIPDGDGTERIKKGTVLRNVCGKAEISN